MPAPFPHHYSSRLTWTGDREGLLSADGQKQALRGGPPVPFDGSSEVWSPEELLLSSLGLCLMTTFMALNAREKLTILRYESETTGVLEKTAQGIVFTEIREQVSLHVAEGEKDRAEATLLKAKKFCIVSNSLKPEVTLSATIVEG